MRIDRRDLKWRARDAMRAASPNALFMTFIYLLLTAGLSGVVSWFVADPLGEVLHLYWQGVSLDRALPLALLAVGRMGMFLNMLMAVWGVVLDFSYRIWCLNTARGDQGEISDLFGGFSMVGRILWLRVLILIYGFLWYLAIFMPAFLGVMVGAMMPVIGPIVSIGVSVLAFVVYISRILHYAMSTYCLIDEPDMGASWALRRSLQIMEGRVKDYVLLMLSFAGWFLLGGLIVTVVEGILMLAAGGVQAFVDPQVAQVVESSMLVSVIPALTTWPLDIWLKPYMTLTACNFYEKIKGGAGNASV